MTKDKNILLIISILIIIISVSLCYSHINEKQDLPVYLEEN